MGFLSRMLATSPSVSQGIGDPNNWIIRAMGGAKTIAGPPVSPYSALAFSAVYCSVGLISDSLAQLPMGVFQMVDGVAVSRPEHPIHRPLSLRPNRYTSSFSMRQTSQHHACLWGNGYQEIQRNGKGQAIALWQLLPDRTYPSYRDGLDGSNDGEMVIRTTVDGKRFTLDPDNVAHIKALGFDGFVGYSPLTLMRQAIGSGLAMEEFGAKFFANDAKSGGFLMHPLKLGPAAQENLEKSMGKEGQGGLDNAHRVKVLEEGMKFLPTTIPPEDAQFLGSRAFQVEEIARFYRIPLILMGSSERNSALGSSVEQLLQAFILWTLQPWTQQWEEEYNYKLFTEAERALGFHVKFNFEALLKADSTARSKLLTALWQMGALTGNEARAREGYNPRPELNRFWAPINYAVIMPDGNHAPNVTQNSGNRTSGDAPTTAQDD